MGIKYKYCERCDTEWEEKHLDDSCNCDDSCSGCGFTVNVFLSEKLRSDYICKIIDQRTVEIKYIRNGVEEKQTVTLPLKK